MRVWLCAPPSVDLSFISPESLKQTGMDRDLLSARPAELGDVLYWNFHPGAGLALGLDQNPELLASVRMRQCD